MTFGERLTGLRKEHGYATRNDFAEKLNIPSTTLRNYETDVREPGHTFLKQISELFNVSVDYLLCLTDEKEVLKSFRLRSEEQLLLEHYRLLDAHGTELVDFVLNKEYERCTTAKEKPVAIVEFASRPGDEHLMKYFRSASAGTGVFILGNEATSSISISKADWLPDGDFVINVDGDSMIPLYNDGDKVIVSQSAEVKHGDIGIFIVNGNVYIKEYGQNELISKNPKADNITISEYDNIVCMGKVIGKITGEYEIMND